MRIIFRVGLYKKLLALGYYVLAVDYRGYGDSSIISPTEASCVTDARAALAWLTAKLGDRVKVVIWGHSLGTAIASHMVSAKNGSSSEPNMLLGHACLFVCLSVCLFVCLCVHSYLRGLRS